MLLRIPFLPLLRLEPQRDLWRVWLWLSAPDSSKKNGWSTFEAQPLPLRSMSDADLFMCSFYWAPHYWAPLHRAIAVELNRRGWRVTENMPTWVKGVASVPREFMSLAEKLLRPYPKRRRLVEA